MTQTTPVDANIDYFFTSCYATSPLVQLVFSSHWYTDDVEKY